MMRALTGDRSFARYRGVFTAFLLTLACLALRDITSTVDAYDRHNLPGFDAYVYVAMAEDPAFFTVAPWGYRVLSPLLVHTLFPSDEVRGFHRVSLAGLALSGPLLFLFLRRQRAPRGLALAATGLFFFSPPVDAVFRNFFVAEPVTLPLVLLALLALDSEDRSARTSFTFAAALALAALAKGDVVLVLLPGFVAAAIASHGFSRGLARAGPGALVAAGIIGALRIGWARYPLLTDPLSIDPMVSAAGTVVSNVGQWWAPLFASGFPLALLGLLMPWGRELARRFGVLALLALSIPFGAAVYNGGPVPARIFFADDVGRLLAYAVPFLLALALAAVGKPLLPRAEARWASDSLDPLRGALVSSSALLVVVVAVILPWTRFDPYRRADLRGPKDGPSVLEFCRTSLELARRLEAQEPVVIESRYASIDSAPAFRKHPLLREGWVQLPGYDEWISLGTGSTLVLPILKPRDLMLTLHLQAPASIVVGVNVNGHRIEYVTAEPGTSVQSVNVPEAALFRGDNRVTLELTESSEPPLSLVRAEVHAAAGARGSDLPSAVSGGGEAGERSSRFESGSRCRAPCR